MKLKMELKIRNSIQKKNDYVTLLTGWYINAFMYLRKSEIYRENKELANNIPRLTTIKKP